MIKIITSHRESGFFWIRFFGKGFYIRDIQKHPPNFSERNGYARGWLVRLLR